MEKIKNYFNGFSVLKWFAFAAMTLLVVLALDAHISRLYWEKWPFEPMVIHGKMKIENPNKTVYSGELITWSMCYDKNMDIMPVIYTELHNSVVITLAPVYPPEKKPGTDLKHSSPFIVPDFAPTGEYTMKKTWVYPIGPPKYGRVVRVSAESEPFYVVKPERQGPKGDRGAQGLVGIQGARGLTGPKGDKGGISFGGKK